MQKLKGVLPVPFANHRNNGGYMKVIIDRFEGDYAICEMPGRKMINIERNKIPANSKEGDAIYIGETGSQIDAEETNKLKENIEKLMDDVWE